MALLDEAHYREFLAETHPELYISDTRLRVPSFVAPLDVREPMRPGIWRDALEVVKELAPSLVIPRALFLGTPFERYDQTHLLDEVAAPETLWEEAERAARETRAEVVVLTNVSPRHERLADWLRAGFVALPSFPDTVIDLRAQSFEQHLAHLPGPDRSGIRRNVRHFEAAGHRLHRLDTSRREARSLFEAYWPFFRGATVRWQPHSSAYFAGLAELDPRVHLTVAKARAGETIGFIVSFEDELGLQAGRVGIHPDWHRRDAVYFRLLYHVLEAAIDRSGGARVQVSLEPTGYRMKRHLGASRRPLVNLVRGIGPIWRGLLSRGERLGRRLLMHLNDPRDLEARY